MGPVRVEEYDRLSGQCLRTLRCDKASLHLDENTAGPGLSLDLYNATVEATGQRMVHHGIRDLTLPDALAQALHRKRVLDMVTPEGAASVLAGSPSSMLAAMQKELDLEIRGALVDIKAEMNSRLVFGIGCIPMIMIGIGLGIIKKGGHLLSAFGVSCIPAVVLIVTIISGKHITENITTQGVSGILVMWAGLACLTVLAALIYARLSRS